jgi:hypothetical protein
VNALADQASSFLRLVGAARSSRMRPASANRR